jgi:hypothetical protein
MWHGREIREVHTEFWWGRPEEKKPLGRSNRRLRIILKWISRSWMG